MTACRHFFIVCFVDRAKARQSGKSLIFRTCTADWSAARIKNGDKNNGHKICNNEWYRCGHRVGKTVFSTGRSSRKGFFWKTPDRIPESFLVTGGFRETGKHDQWNDDRYSNPAGWDVWGCHNAPWRGTVADDLWSGNAAGVSENGMCVETHGARDRGCQRAGTKRDRFNV